MPARADFTHARLACGHFRNAPRWWGKPMTSMVHRAGTHQRDRQDLRRLSVLDHVHAAMMLMRSYRCRLNDEADRQRDVQLMTERPWLDVPIVYSGGRRAIITVEKAAPGERALAVLGLAPPMASGQPREVPGVVPDATIEPASENPRVPIDLSLPGAVVKPWPIRDAPPSEGRAPLNQVLETASGRQLAALPSTQPREPIRPKRTLPVLERPT
jgi:hypothetical protein